MPQPIRTREEWAEIHATAVALGSIRAAAKAHGVPEDAAYQRARREKWLVGNPANVQAARAERVERAEAAGVVVSTRVRATPGPDILHEQIWEQGQQTRAMLAQALTNAAGQARRTKHPLARARLIRDVASAAATVHPDQFGGGAEENCGSKEDAQARINAAIVMIFGDRAREQWAMDVTADGGTDTQPVISLEDTGGEH